VFLLSIPHCFLPPNSRQLYPDLYELKAVARFKIVGPNVVILLAIDLVLHGATWRGRNGLRPLWLVIAWIEEAKGGNDWGLMGEGMGLRLKEWEWPWIWIETFEFKERFEYFQWSRREILKSFQKSKSAWAQKLEFENEEIWIWFNRIKSRSWNPFNNRNFRAWLKD
jgi:hypothetical protein